MPWNMILKMVFKDFTKIKRYLFDLRRDPEPLLTLLET